MTNLQKLKKALIECKPQEVVNKYALLVAEEYGKATDPEFLKKIGYIEIKNNEGESHGEFTKQKHTGTSRQTKPNHG